MKKLLLILLIAFTSTACFGQNLNEQLYKAVSAKDTVRVQTLLKNGADANYHQKTGGFLVMSMLILAVQNSDYKTTQLLLANKVDVDWRDVFDSTALMYAASKGDKQTVLYLIKNGADVNARDKGGNSVLSAARESKSAEVIALIEGLIKK